MRIIATLPYPPSVNHYWVMGGGHIYISPEGRAYARRVASLLEGTPVIEGPVRVMILTSPPDNRKRDLDNVLKCLLDSLTKAHLWHDDSQIVDLSIQRGDTHRDGCVELVVEAISDPQRKDGEG